MAKRSGSGQGDLFGEEPRLQQRIRDLAAEMGASTVRDITREAIHRQFWAEMTEEAILIRAHCHDVEAALRVEDKAGLPQFAERGDGNWVQRVLFTDQDYDQHIRTLVRQVRNDQRRVRKWQAEMLHRYGWATEVSAMYRDDGGEDEEQ